MTLKQKNLTQDVLFSTDTLREIVQYFDLKTIAQCQLTSRFFNEKITHPNKYLNPLTTQQVDALKKEKERHLIKIQSLLQIRSNLIFELSKQTFLGEADLYTKFDELNSVEMDLRAFFNTYSSSVINLVKYLATTGFEIGLTLAIPAGLLDYNSFFPVFQSVGMGFFRTGIMLVAIGICTTAPMRQSLYMQLPSEYRKLIEEIRPLIHKIQKIDMRLNQMGHNVLSESKSEPSKSFTR